MTRSLLEASDAPPPRLDRARGDAGAFAELRRRLRDAGIFRPCPDYYARKLVEVIALWTAGFVAVVVLRSSNAVASIGLVLGLASAQTVLLAHDCAHGVPIASGRFGRALGRGLSHVLIGLLSGGSASWWRQSHDTHHALSNDPSLDPDIDYPFLAFDDAQLAAKQPQYAFFLRRQHILVWLVLPFVAVTMRLYSVRWLVVRLLRERGRRARRSLELALLVVHWVLYVGALVWLLPPTRAIALAAVHQAVFGTYLALITATNHWAMPMPDARGLSFLEHQVSTSRNIRGGALVRFLYGGLDCQIEHHLFATLPRPRVRQARPIVRAFCDERQIPYVEASPWEALAAIRQRLAEVARVARTPEAQR